MLRVIGVLFINILLIRMQAIAQCLPGNFSVECEIERAGDSVIKLHGNDDFYFFARFLPGVRVSIDDYVLARNGEKWTAKHYKTTFNPQPWVRTKKKRKRKLTVTEIRDSILVSFLESADIKRLENLTISDSTLLNISELKAGEFEYFMVICSKGKVKRIEYPVNLHYDKTKDREMQNIYWQSGYLDNLIKKIKIVFAD